jgi:hypothetical protein
MCPVNVKKIDDIKQVMKYTDHKHKDFWIAVLAWEKPARRSKTKYWARNEYGGLKYK